MSALIFYNLPDVSWAGFYLVRDGKLILGPFQGKIASTEIKFGKREINFEKMSDG